MDELKFLIVEGNATTAASLEQQIESIGCYPVKTVDTVLAALKYVDREVVDAVIANVFINGKPEGIELAAQLKTRHLPIFLIAASEDPEIYRQARQVQPMGYFVQPFSKYTLKNTIDISLKQRRLQRPFEVGFVQDAFFVKQNNLLRKIPIDEVFWIKTEGNYSLIHTTTKKYILKLSLKKVLEQLPTTYFIQIQRAYIIALSKIEDIDTSTSEVIINKERLPLGRNYKEGLFSRLNILK
ncbi:MAG: LytR/AlgR family response regulator transcription factor [Saprospiraceae bacterium]